MSFPKESGMKASISRINPYIEKEKAVNYSYRWEYSR